MKKTIKENTFYDDPTRKKLSQVETVMQMNEAFSLLISGVKILEQLSQSVSLDQELRVEILQSTKILLNELEQLHPHLNKHIQSTKLNNITKTDSIIGQLGGGDITDPISMNETTYRKIQNTINRIKDVNKKINHYGTKSN